MNCHIFTILEISQLFFQQSNFKEHTDDFLFSLEKKNYIQFQFLSLILFCYFKIAIHIINLY